MNEAQRIPADMRTAPKNATEIQALVGGKVITVHWACDLSGEEQPPFRGWFTQAKGGKGFVQVEPEGWFPQPILFLDIDGVLNNGRFNTAAQSTTLKPACVRRLNTVLGETDAAIVLSSAWRYLVHNGAMSLRGFEMMLRSHGLACEDRIAGLLPNDPSLPYEELSKKGCEIRAWQITNWLIDSGHIRQSPWAVVDDLDLPIEPRERFVRTQGSVGLTNADARKLTKLLLTRP